MALKVAIVGLSPTSHHLAPWGNTDWELWGLTWDVDRFKFDRTFEMHDIHTLEQKYIDYLDGLAPYMQEAYESVPGAKRYPFEEVAQTTGDYWCSSVGYMLALAIHEGASEIGLYGVDMKSTEEYAYQRPNVEYLIGLARGKGIKVHIPDSSPIGKFLTDPEFGYSTRYGSTK